MRTNRNKAQPRKNIAMDVYVLLGSWVRRATHRTKSAQRSRLLHVSGIGASLTLAAIAATLAAVQSGKAQTGRAGTSSSNTPSESSQNGKVVFISQGCNKCHGSQGEGFSSPGSNDTTPRISSTTLALPSFIELIRRPKGRMPPFGSRQVSDQELTDVYAFLQSLAPPVEHDASVATNTKSGQQLFIKYGCYECHLSRGQGARITGARLGPPQIPLSAFMSYVRTPTGEMPPYTQKTIPDEELAAIYAFLQSVPQPASWKTIPLLNQ
jgi:mono/diheme cytochrome c family protein